MVMSRDNDEERDRVRGRREESIARCGSYDGEVVAGSCTEPGLVWEVEGLPLETMNYW